MQSVDMAMIRRNVRCHRKNLKVLHATEDQVVHCKAQQHVQGLHLGIACISQCHRQVHVSRTKV